jgi:hypothetical protein
MADNTGQQAPPTPPPTQQYEERAIRESAWQVVQQGAQVVGELGGGVGGIALAVHLAKGGGGTSPPSSPPPANNPPPPSGE